VNFLEHMHELAKKRAAGMDLPEGDAIWTCRAFKEALTGMAVIAEVKYATPAEGDLGMKQAPSELAADYESLGAAAISCLTEPTYFAGKMAYISEIRNACTLPVLMKDFIVDERQIRAGRLLGADAFLLITEMLSQEELEGLYVCGRDLGMDCLVEVHGREGIGKAVRIGAEIIGVNSRDLTTLKVVPERHEKLFELIPDGVVKVAESGISSKERLRELRSMGYDAALIGRAMARQDMRMELLSCG
jgi:indole-3-glycerol phosphate synthase